MKTSTSERGISPAATPQVWNDANPIKGTNYIQARLYNIIRGERCSSLFPLLMCLIIHLRVATREGKFREKRGLEIETESLRENTWHISRQFPPTQINRVKVVGQEEMLLSPQNQVLYSHNSYRDKVPKWVRFCIHNHSFRSIKSTIGSCYCHPPINQRPLKRSYRLISWGGIWLWNWEWTR